MFRLFAKVVLSVSLIFLVLFPDVISPSNSVSAQGSCGETYTVLPGDTLSEIAELCQTTVVAILDANPEMTDPTDIFVGQVIRIPRSSISPVLAISPTCGSAGNLITILGSGFPPNNTVEVSLNPENQSRFIVLFLTSDNLGMIRAETYIPLYAAPYSAWSVTGEADSGNIHFEAVSNTFTVLWPIPDPSGATTYIVQQGDTLGSIAVKFNRSIEAIYSANPQIGEPPRLSTGQTIQIPTLDPNGPQLKLSPFCGPADASITVNGSSFPAGSQVNLRVGEYLETSEPAGNVEMDSSTTFSTSVVIPPIAVPGENWLVQANTNQPPIARSNSNIYAVVPPPDPGGPAIYVIQPQDTLNEIAIEFTRTPNAILAANPQITNENTLPVGGELLIPGLRESVLLTPSSGPPGTRIQVVGAGFPPQSKVEVAFGRRGGTYALIETAITNTNGLFGSQVEIPSNALAGERWVVLATESVASGPRPAALSNDFVVSQPKPPAEAFISIWPTAGPQDTKLTVVASGFPANTQVTFSLGQAGFEGSTFLTTWTEINGTAAGDTRVPMTAAPGENWTVTVRTLMQPIVESTSDVFTVTEADGPVFDSVNIFLVDPGNGDVGCGDAILPVSKAVASTQAPINTAIGILLADKNRIDAESGFYNALYLSDLTLQSIEQEEEILTIRLSGEYQVQEDCDNARVQAQLEQTAIQYSSAQTVDLFINGEPFDTFISEQ